MKIVAGRRHSRDNKFFTIKHFRRTLGRSTAVGVAAAIIYRRRWFRTSSSRRVYRRRTAADEHTEPRRARSDDDQPAAVRYTATTRTFVGAGAERYGRRPSLTVMRVSARGASCYGRNGVRGGRLP